MSEQLPVDIQPAAVVYMHDALHGAIDSVASWYENQKRSIAVVAVAVGMTASAAACAGVEAQGSGGTTIPGTAPTTEVAPPTTTAGGFEFSGVLTEGDDATVRLEDDANLYDCGGVKGETYKNPDGTEKPFNPDNLISHMNTHPELAKSDSQFWTDIFSDEGLSFLAAHGAGNQQHQDSVTVTAPDVAPGYPDFIAKQNAAAIKVDAVAGNFACKTATGEYKVFPVGPKQLHAGETHLTGIVLTKADYEAFIGVLQANGKNLDSVFTQEMKVEDKEVVVVFAKHEMCANNELKIPAPAPAPEKPGTPTINTVPQRPPVVTVTTVPGVTTTNVPKVNAHPPVTGGAPTTVEAPVPQVTPEPTLAPRNPNTTVPPTQPTQTPVNNPTTIKPPTGIPNPDQAANFTYTVSQ